MPAGAGTGAAIDLAGGGTVTNMLTGTIIGGTNGVYITGGPGAVFNTGTIRATAGQAVLLGALALPWSRYTGPRG